MKVGDTCKLKSGGPVMTVIEVDHDWATCIWFDARNEETKQKNFPIAGLEKWSE